MRDLEDVVREALAAHADDAPTPARLMGLEQVRRRERQRRAAWTVCLAAAAACVAGASVMFGNGRQTAVVPVPVPVPPAATATAPAASPSTERPVPVPVPDSTPSSDFSLQPSDVVVFAGASITVTYPDGRGGTTAVRWPAPASGIAWFLDDPKLLARPPGPVTAGARQVEAMLLSAVHGAAAAEGSPRVIGTVGDRATAYAAGVAMPLASGSSGGAAGSGAKDGVRIFLVSMTRGGVTTYLNDFDYCGTWPDSARGLGDHGSVDVRFEFNGARTCSLATTAKGATLVHLVVQQGRRSGEVPEPAPMQLLSFTVRGDGTAVCTAAVAPLDAEWSAADVSRVFRQLDELALTLPYPEQN